MANPKPKPKDEGPYDRYEEEAKGLRLGPPPGAPAGAGKPGAGKPDEPEED